MDALKEVKEIFRDIFEKHSLHMIEKVFGDVTNLFAGRMKGFHRCDTRYHDIQHTIKTVIVMIQIMDGWNKSGSLPIVSQRVFELGIIAALLHDVGYIKRLGDRKGTGAKYTFRHVKRSIEFARHYLSSLRYSRETIFSVQNMIWCTCNQTKLSNLKFLSKEEEIAAFSLGTADILAQMSVYEYLEKLGILFDEFREAYEYEGIDRLRQRGHTVFGTLDELIKNTPHFYETWIKNRFKDMDSVYRFITAHHSEGRNYYMESLEKNLEKISTLAS